MPTPQLPMQTLYVAFELSAAQWKLAFSNGEKMRLVNIDARDLKQLRTAVKQAQQKLGVPKEAPVHSCYEAGRDGFWLHRWLEGEGIDNRVVDPSAIQVTRRAKHAKTDRIDAQKLVAMLIREVGGEPRVWRTCRVPTVAEEDDRQPQRELLALQEERTRVSNQIRALLMRFGIRIESGKSLPREPEGLKQRNGEPLPPRTQEQLRRSREHFDLLTRQIKQVEDERVNRLREVLRSVAPEEPRLGQGRAQAAAPVRKLPPAEAREQRVARQVLKLMSLKGIGLTSAMVFVTEFFGWRQFQNRQEVGAAAGLDGTPFNSGESEREQGISKAGNRRIRSMAVEIAWDWLRYQPNSALSRWYFDRVVVERRKHVKKKNIAAVARRMLIALWRYLEKGIVPEGAELKPMIALQ